MSQSYDIDHEAEASKKALLAIIARIQGEWDNPYLMEFGALHTNTMDDVLRIAESVGLTKDSVYQDETEENNSAAPKI